MGATINNGQQPKSQGGLKAFYWGQIFGMYSAVVTTLKQFSSPGGFLTYALHHLKNQNNLFDLTCNNETKKMTHDS